MSVTLEIPSDIASSVRVPPQGVEKRLFTELAIALYSQNLLTSGMACSLAGLSLWQWEDLLGDRGIVRHYGDADLNEDLYGSRSQ